MTRTVNRDRTSAPLAEESSQSPSDSASEDSSEYADQVDGFNYSHGGR